MTTKQEVKKLQADLKRAARILAGMVYCSVHACAEHKRMARKVMDLEQRLWDFQKRGA